MNHVLLIVTGDSSVDFVFNVGTSSSIATQFLVFKSHSHGEMANCRVRSGKVQMSLDLLIVQESCLKNYVILKMTQNQFE